MNYIPNGVSPGSKFRVAHVGIQETGQVVFWCHVPIYSTDQIQIVNSELAKHNYKTVTNEEECLISNIDSNMDKIIDNFNQLEVSKMYFVYSRNSRYKGHHRAILCCKNIEKESAVFWYPEYGFYEVHSEFKKTVKAEIREKTVTNLSPAVVAVKLGELYIEPTHSNIMQLSEMSFCEMFVNRVYNQEMVVLSGCGLPTVGFSIQSVAIENQLKKLNILGNGALEKGLNVARKRQFFSSRILASKVYREAGTLNFWYNSVDQVRTISKELESRSAEFNQTSEYEMGDFVLLKRVNEFSRCQVLSVGGTSAFLVNIDNGETLNEPFEKIRTIKTNSIFQNMPRQVYPCTFQNLIPTNLTKLDQLLDKFTNNYTQVDRINDSRTNVLGYQYVNASNANEISLKSRLIAVSEGRSGPIVKEITPEPHKIPNYVNRTVNEHEAVITFVKIEKRLIHAKVLKLSKSRSYEQLKTKLNRFYRNSKNNQSEITEFLPGRFVAFEMVSKSGNKDWHRGEITRTYCLNSDQNPFANSVLEERVSEHMILDILDCETGELHQKISPSNCRCLANDFTIEPVCYIKSKLPTLEMSNLKVGEKVRFIVGHTGEYILQNIPKQSSSYTVQHRSRRDYLPNLIQFQEMAELRQLINDQFLGENYQKIMCLLFQGPIEQQVCDIEKGQFYICNREMFRQRSLLEVQMSEFFDDYTPPSIPLKGGKPVKGMHVVVKTRNKYHRGVYLNVWEKICHSDDGISNIEYKFKILHVDYGTFGWYSTNELFMLDNSLTEISPCAILIELQSWQKLKKVHSKLTNNQLLSSLTEIMVGTCDADKKTKASS